jgi:hypothetical protein
MPPAAMIKAASKGSHKRCAADRARALLMSGDRVACLTPLRPSSCARARSGISSKLSRELQATRRQLKAEEMRVDATRAAAILKVPLAAADCAESAH